MNSLASKLEHILKLSFEAKDGPKIVVDADGLILYASRFHYEYLGIENEKDIIGRPVDEVIPGTRMSIVLKTQIPEYGYLFHFYNKKYHVTRTVICNRIPVFENGKIIGVVCETTFPESMEPVINLAETIKKLNIRENEIRSDNILPNLAKIIIGVSPQIDALRRMIAQISVFPLPVLITGETGTGKEVFANAIHQLSSMNTGNFVKINCAAIPGDLLESELFGYEKGAFSGAAKDGKVGKFEYAGNGSILLDEIGDMPLNLQVKLLRVLQEKEFERVGGVKTIPFNARIIATSNCHMRELVEKKKFRQDLFYRLNVIEIEIPPLRERKEDIEVLCDTFIQTTNEAYGLCVAGMSREVLKIFQNYNWPGNVRELRHVIERACVFCGNGTLLPHHISLNEDSQLLPFVTSSETVFPHFSPESDIDEILSLDEARKQAEIKQIKKALKYTEGNKSLAAKLLQVDRTVLYSKIKKYNL